jgi:hypothetical protein
MSFRYIVEIKQGNAVVEASAKKTISSAVKYADRSSLDGDLVVISEGYQGADGEYDIRDHVLSWYAD